jgi:hypothetical protein
VLNHNHGRPDGATTAVVIDLFAKKRDRLSKKLGVGHPALRPRETQTELATVTPIRAGRRWRASRGD